MSVRIQFDKPNEWPFTNLDWVSGKIVLTLPSDASISAITVKLEGESRTRLAGPKSPYSDRQDKRRTELEHHKLLYKVQTVFPAPEIREKSSAATNYTLVAGTYEYPFKIKFPFNNYCTSNNSLLRDLKLGELSLQYGNDANRHVKKTLPPSLSGFPGEAEIKYYVKATVIRPKFYQGNIRNLVNIKFLPIEPPKPRNTHEETFARRKQQFQNYPAQPVKKSLFRRSPHPDVAPGVEPPIFQVDARLPNPAILTCNEALPLRILVQRLNNTFADAYLSTLQIELIGYTHVRARDLTRKERTPWILVSAQNLQLPLGSPSDKRTKEWKIPSRLWDNKLLPNTVAPSFETCNLSRTYELEIRVGLAHAVSGGIMPELIVLPLLLPVQVYSGVKPPPELLQAMAASAAKNPFHPVNIVAAASGASQSPQSPILPPPPTPTTSSYDSFPALVGTPASPHPSTEDDDMLPSYEDAIAEDIAPVDGPRRNYFVPTDPEQSSFSGDSKSSGGLGRRMSERLFSQNGPMSPRRSTFGSTSDPISRTTSVDEEEIGVSDGFRPPSLSPSQTRS